MKKFYYIFCLFGLLASTAVAQQFKDTDFGIITSCGHHATGVYDTLKAELMINKDNIMVIVPGYMVREKYSYCGDRMPNGLPNNGGIYADRWYMVKRLDENMEEIKTFIWMSRTLEEQN